MFQGKGPTHEVFHKHIFSSFPNLKPRGPERERGLFISFCFLNYVDQYWIVELLFVMKFMLFYILEKNMCLSNSIVKF